MKRKIIIDKSRILKGLMTARDKTIRFLKSPRRITWLLLVVLSLTTHLFLLTKVDAKWVTRDYFFLTNSVIFVPWIIYLIVVAFLDGKKKRAITFLSIVALTIFTLVTTTLLILFIPEKTPKFLGHLSIFLSLFTGPVLIIVSLAAWAKDRCKKSERFGKKLKFILPVILIISALWISFLLLKTAPQAGKKRPQKQATLVNTTPLKSGNETVILKLTGTVIPAEEISLRARVSGEVIQIHPEFMEGGLLQKGEAILNIDPVDFELALAQSESAVQKATFEHKLELGRQDIARREWELLGLADDASESEKELALRLPHLAASEAALAAAQATLEKSKLDLSRTTLHAAFNAVVLSRNVNIGSQASQQDVLATLAGTDRYWVQASVPVDRLDWITIPGSAVTLHSPSGATREGRVIKRLGNLEEKGRMARILIAVDDPLCLTAENQERTPLLLGQYIRVGVKGRELEQVYSIPRSALHENRLIWIASPNSTLDIREVDVRWRAEKNILVSGNLRDGERLITTDISTPMQGLTLNTGKKMNKPVTQQGRNQKN